VIDTGNNIWIGNLMTCRGAEVSACPQVPFIKMTENILMLFGAGPTGITTPSAANLATITPTNS
jgi:hypothetical protein